MHLAGENDPVHPVFSAEETARHIGNLCQLEIISNTGDPVYRDKPEESEQIIKSFISGLIHNNNFTLKR